MRTDVIRTEVERLLNQRPFRPFVLTLENGQQIPIEHPENIAFEPSNGTGGGSPDFYVLSGKLRLYSTFEAVSNVVMLNRGESA